MTLHLTFLESADDFCPSTTESKFQQLPAGCEHNGKTVVDVGACARLRCRGDVVNNETCSDTEVFCCAATEFERVTIQCDDFNITVYKTITCGCSMCTHPVVDIVGFVFTEVDNSPVEKAIIYYNKTEVAETRSNGQFHFNVPEGTLRVSIAVKAPNASEYADGIGVLNLNEDADGVYYITIKLTKVKVLDPIDSKEDQTLMLESGNTEVEVHIPKNSFYDDYGNLYQVRYFT